MVPEESFPNNVPRNRWDRIVENPCFKLSSFVVVRRRRIFPSPSQLQSKLAPQFWPFPCNFIYFILAGSLKFNMKLNHHPCSLQMQSSHLLEAAHRCRQPVCPVGFRLISPKEHCTDGDTPSTSLQPPKIGSMRWSYTEVGLQSARHVNMLILITHPPNWPSVHREGW